MPACVDLTGERIWDFVVKGIASPKGEHKKKWECQCKCGNIAYVSTLNLNSSIVRCCVSCRKDDPFDLTGFIFNNLEVTNIRNLEPAIITWNCRCLVCGDVQAYEEGYLLSGKCWCPNKCGSVQRQKHLFEDDRIQGRTFGHLTTIRRVDPAPPQPNSRWECRCQCGMVIKAAAIDLLTGEVNNCGCLAVTPKFSLKNSLFGWLKPKELVFQDLTKGAMYRCLCRCGNGINFYARDLITQNIRDCGCGMVKLAKLPPHLQALREKLKSKGKPELAQWELDNNLRFAIRLRKRLLKLPPELAEAIWDLPANEIPKLNRGQSDLVFESAVRLCAALEGLSVFHKVVRAMKSPYAVAAQGSKSRNSPISSDPNETARLQQAMSQAKETVNREMLFLIQAGHIK